jgi:hypothetical protein
MITIRGDRIAALRPAPLEWRGALLQRRFE